MYVFNESKVYADYADDQYIVLNYVTGAYYSFDKASSIVLRALTNGCDPKSIAASFEERYGSECDALDKVNSFANKLKSLDIIIPGGDDNGAAEDFIVSVADDLMPDLDCEVYTDVADLLLMDPIHEVDEEAGWPVQKE